MTLLKTSRSFLLIMLVTSISTPANNWNGHPSLTEILANTSAAELPVNETAHLPMSILDVWAENIVPLSEVSH